MAADSSPPPAPVTVLAFEMQAAIGTSLLVITADSPASLTTRSGSAADLDWAVTGPFTGAAIFGAWDGKCLASKVAGRLLRLFAAVLPAVTAVAALVLVDAVV